VLEARAGSGGAGRVGGARTASDDAVVQAAASLTERNALTCLTAERALVQALEATCHTPIGAHAMSTANGLRLTSFVGLPDGSWWIRDELEGAPDEPAALGAAMAERLLAAGAAELLAEAERVAFAP
jgi:hydroxymethylbilane synthase